MGIKVEWLDGRIEEWPRSYYRVEDGVFLIIQENQMTGQQLVMAVVPFANVRKITFPK